MANDELIDVLIVGAGPTGLTLACELARRDINIKIIDKLDKPGDKSKALVLHARSLELLDMMGALPAFMENGTPITGVNIFDSDKRIAHLSLDQIDSPYPYALGIPQCTTERLLYEFLQAHGREVDRNVELIAVEDKGDHVIARVKTSGSETELKCRYLVACDGAHSTTRHAINEPYEGGEYREDFQLADVEVDCGDRHKANEIFAFSSGSGNAAFFPMPGNRWRVAVVLPEPLSEEALKRQPALEEIQAKVDQVVPYKLRLSDPHWLANFKIRYRKVKHYRHNRVFLAGDAAHCHSPVGGQGMNTGMQDSFNLGWKLALAVQGLASEALLDSYHFERNAVAVQLLHTVDMMTRVNLLRAPIAREIRNRLAPFLVSQEGVQSRLRNFMSEIGINYRRSPVVSEVKRSLVSTAMSGKDSQTKVGDWFEFSQGPHAGDRAIDASICTCDGDNMHLMSLFRSTKHHLLLFTGDSPSSHTYSELCEFANKAYEKYSDFLDVSLISSEEEPTCELNILGKRLSDPDYSAHERYGAGASCLYLIRPDTYVGLRCQPTDFTALENYFSTILH